VPLRAVRRQWKHRPNVTLMQPMFPGYIFAALSAANYVKALSCRGAIEVLGTHKGPSVVPTEQIDAIKRLVAEDAVGEPYPHLARGVAVRVSRGPLSGICGVLDSRSSGYVFYVNVELLGRTLPVKIDADSLERL